MNPDTTHNTPLVQRHHIPPNALCSLGVLLATLPVAGAGEIVFETTSPYHRVLVVDQGDLRILSFDGSAESRMSKSDPLQGHFDYTEIFHMPWLWNTNISRVLMIGLGGGTTQKTFEHYYPEVTIDTVELDPVVVQAAKLYFGFKESARQRVHLQDGRLFLKRTRRRYDLVILDAYTTGRYGASIPSHLATREFFQIARNRMTDNGVLAYNIIGTADGADSAIVGALYRTMNTVFPKVYAFPSRTSRNIVLIATVSSKPATLFTLTQQAEVLVRTGKVKLPGFKQRVMTFRPRPPASASTAPVLTDDYAPIEGLLRGITPRLPPR